MGEDAGYSTDGSFTVSFWATKPDCRMVGRSEYIYAHSKFDMAPEDRGPNGEANPAIAISYLCSENGGQTTIATPAAQPGRRSSPLHFLRVNLNDDTGATAIFDIPLNRNHTAEGGGFITNQWIHIAIESDRHPSNSTLSAVSAFIDGKRVPGALLGAPPDTLRSNQAWSAAASRVDIAHLSLSTMSIDTAENIPAAGNGINFERCVEWGSGSPSSVRDFTDEMVRDRLMTVQMCATLCEESSVSTTHFAVGRHQACFCGSAMSRAASVDDSMCSSGCAGDGTIKCGGHLPGRGDYFTIYSFDSHTRMNKPWELLPNPLFAARAVHLGGNPWAGAQGQASGGFLGNVADLAIFDRALGDKDIDCLFRETERGLGSCDPQNLRPALSAYLGQAQGAPRGTAAGDQIAAPDGRQDGQVHLFPDPWLDVTQPGDDVPSGAHKVGQSLVLCTQLSPADWRRCATADEIAVGATVAAPAAPAGAAIDAVPNFAADGTFGLSVWFQRGWCSRVDGAQDATLLSWQPAGGGTASVNVQVICARSTRAPSTLAGHVLRIEVVDDVGTAVSKDVSVAAELGDGLVVDKWANLILGVQPTKVEIVVDSNAARYFDFRGNATGLVGFDQARQSTRTNAAYPATGDNELATALSTFATLSETIFLGGAPNVVTVEQWVGEMQMLHGFGRPLSDSDMRCLYRTQLAQRE